MSATKSIDPVGVRCGHIDGWVRQRSYVVGEECLVDLAFEPSPSFREGYEIGYRLGAAGTLLPKHYQHSCERKPRNWA